MSAGRRGPAPPPPSQEPLIVVEEAEGIEEEEDDGGGDNSLDERFEDEESPPPTPGLLCPDIRDRRKRSLPTPSCASGITASQVRRLSERGTAHTRRDAAFLATLTSAPAPGRRHSVTISRVPPLPVFRPRRESLAGCAPASRPIDPVTSFQLQLDIMDDIAEVKARKVRLKVKKTPSKERVCEVQHLDSQGALLKAPGGAGTSTGRRHSEGAPRGKKGGGIVCSDTDLVSLLSLSPSGSPPTGRQQQEAEAAAAAPAPATPPASPPPVVTVEAPDPPTPSPPATPNKVVWDGGSGSVVDAHQLGTAIEEYLRLQDLGPSTSSTQKASKGPAAAPSEGPASSSAAGSSEGPSGAAKGSEEATSESSLCSTLKDLFVK
ncbi:lysine-specific demethylase 6B-like [Ischnura elegans]|uniref:lysine-specific demethylase 6B-like n=1 Tax=Ischnura elegans TaxID=197161 RepID=UPI001ED8AFEB|nr:lysine-specific demethylase 6B-like [Ischnura elegans]